MELWRRAAVVATKKGGGLEVRYGPGDVEVWCMELWRHVVGVQTWRYGALEECRMEASRYGALNLWRRDAGVGTWRHGGQDRAAGVAMWTHL